MSHIENIYSAHPVKTNFSKHQLMSQANQLKEIVSEWWLRFIFETQDMLNKVII